MTTTPEPKGKLDAMTTRQAVKSAGSDVVVNGPEDQTLDWHAVDWHAAQANVRRLRQRIFTASQAGDLKKVRNLQKLMLRSHANTLLSVRRVTEINAGARPALLPTSTPLGLLEPDAWKHASPVLRGDGRSNAPVLPGPPFGGV